MATKSTKGKQKVNMEKIQNKNQLQVAFSKRRNGLFKKANELSILCGAEIALVVFSPGGKVYSFGHPSVDYVIDKYLNKNSSPRDGTNDIVEAQPNAKVDELYSELSRLENLLEAEKEHGKALVDQTRTRYWWQAFIRQLNLEQLEQLKQAMEGRKKNVAEEINSRRLMIQASTFSRYLAERSRLFGTNLVPSNAMQVPFGAGASGPSGIDLNSVASTSGGSYNSADGIEPSHAHKFF